MSLRKVMDGLTGIIALFTYMPIWYFIVYTLLKQAKGLEDSIKPAKPRVLTWLLYLFIALIVLAFVLDSALG